MVPHRNLILGPALSLLLAGSALAQAVDPVAPASSAPAAQSAKVPEGVEMEIRFNETLSSGTNTEGDKFSISLNEAVTLPDGTVIPPGYSGRGEVVSAKKKGMMGQAGEMNIRLDYIRIGDTRIRVRASRGGEGKSAVGTTVALAVLFGPLGLLKRGHDLEIKSGQTLRAFVDQDAEISLPLPPPPRQD